MNQISIITPTFNRAIYLPRIYKRLCQQNDIDFEWIIVDDGSSDNTSEVVSTFNKVFEIKYLYQENSGQLSARNTGTQNANSYILAKLDDDDLICPHVLKRVWNYFDIKTGLFENGCACLSGLCQYENGEIVGEKFPHDYYVSDHIRYRQNRPIHGDKFEFYVTEIFKKYPFPVIKGEKNMPPHIVHDRIARSYKTLYINDIFAIKNFLKGGLSTQKYIYKYTLGSELYYNEASMPPYKLRLQIKHSSNYIYFAKINKKIKIYLNAKNKKVFPFGLCRYYLILCKEFMEKIPFLRFIIKFFLKDNKYAKRVTSK